MTGNLLIRNVRPWGAPATDLLIQGGHIARIGPDLPAERTTVEDGGGCIALPGPGRGAHPSRQVALGHGLAPAPGRTAAD